MIKTFVSAYWWKIIVGVFSLGVMWATLQAKMSNYEQRQVRVEKETAEHHDFIVEQRVLNRQMEGMDKKIDRLLRRSDR